MNKLLSFLLLGLLSFVCFGDEEEAVVTLTGDNFEEFVGSKSRVLVEFYAPWCGHCKALAPEYEKAAKVIHEDESIEDTFLAKVDATEYKDLATKYGVKGFPTLKYFTNGNVEEPDDYSGGRTESTIISWLRVRSMPAVSKLDSEDALNEFKTKSKLTAVAFFADDGEEFEAIKTVAEANREKVLFGSLTDKLIVDKLDGIEFGSLYLFRDFSEPVVKYNGKLTVDDITIFLNSERFPLIDAIGPDNYKDYMDRGLPLVWLSLNVADEEEKTNVINRLESIAAENKGKLSFTWIDAQKYEQHVNNLGITETPGILIAETTSNLKYLFKGDITNNNELITFFNNYNDGTLDAHLKSAEIPESNDESVYVLVGKSFNNIIGSEKDVFVEFYAPWCGHCKRLAPEYEKVGDVFADVENVIIAKIDATENDTPEDIRGFPTLIFYPANKKEGVKYSGDRTAQAIVDFIKENASQDTSAAKTEL